MPLIPVEWDVWLGYHCLLCGDNTLYEKAEVFWNHLRGEHWRELVLTHGQWVFAHGEGE
jgi:hypothetical protein